MPKIDALGFTTLAKSFIIMVALLLHLSSVNRPDKKLTIAYDSLLGALSFLSRGRCHFFGHRELGVCVFLRSCALPLKPVDIKFAHQLVNKQAATLCTDLGFNVCGIKVRGAREV